MYELFYNNDPIFKTGSRLEVIQYIQEHALDVDDVVIIQIRNGKVYIFDYSSFEKEYTYGVQEFI